MTQAASGTLPIDTPLQIDEPDTLHWDGECEVLVAGFGAAGAAAAIAAKEAGAQVTIVDRFNMGGASARSGGVVYAGGGTPHQLKAGFEDTPEAMFNYLKQEVGDAVKPETLRRFCDDSREQLAWLESLGASFESEVPPPKTSYPKDGCYLYYSGNEGIPPFSEQATPAPRGHRTVDKGLSGKALFGFLRKRVESLNIPVLGQTAVQRLIQDQTGRVIGVEVRQLKSGSRAARRHARLMRMAEFIHNLSGGHADALRARARKIEVAAAQTLKLRAHHGVILSTGGFIFNRDMVAKHAPKFARNMRLGTTGCDGSGIRLGLSVGGQAERMDKLSAWRFINPPSTWPQGIVVNQDGRRYCHEGSYGARIGVEMCENHGGRSWLIIDARIRAAAMREALGGGLWAFQSVPAVVLMMLASRAQTITGLATALKLPADVLQGVLEEHNYAARAGQPDAFGKAAPLLAPLDQPPFYAINISANNPGFPCPTITLGGLRIDEDSGAVVNGAGKAIPGLYAAGRCAIGIASNGYVSGLSLADCLWSGRRAGRCVVQQNESATAAA